MNVSGVLKNLHHRRDAFALERSRTL